jgi:hypothetical protein
MIAQQMIEDYEQQKISVHIMRSKVSHALKSEGWVYVSGFYSCITGDSRNYLVHPEWVEYWERWMNDNELESDPEIPDNVYWEVC